MIETVTEAVNALAARISSGDPLAFAGLSLLAALAAYMLVRRLMRVRWLMIAMRIGYFLGVAGLVGLGILTLAYYKLDAWLPVGGSLVMDIAREPVMWIAIASILGAGWALRKPVAPRHRVRISNEPAGGKPAYEPAPETKGDGEDESWRRAA